MRIRGRNLPHPILVSDPSPSSTHRLLVLPPKASNTRGQPAKANAFVKIEEKGLHPNGDLRFLDPHGLRNNSIKTESQIISPSSSNQVQEEEKATVHESTSNGGAESNITINRILTTNDSPSQEQGKDSKKPKRSSTALMEGSRCSRINGRGWRCSQPTLVGYSLCEHHLGKGRQKGLIGTSTVRGGQLGCTDQQRRNLNSHKGLMDESVRKKKARSITSLLDDQRD